MLQTWPASTGDEEYAAHFSDHSGATILVLPAWFDESNKLRHFTIETMRALDAAGLNCALPDLPGCNESTAPLSQQSLQSWRTAAHAAAEHFSATHVLTLRAGANIAPELPGWAYAPLAGKSALRAMLRARIIASKEAGQEEKREDLLTTGKSQGLELAGYSLGAEMIAQMAEAELPTHSALREISQSELGGPGLWLRMEPDHDATQAKALAARIIADIGT